METGPQASQDATVQPQAIPGARWVHAFGVFGTPLLATAWAGLTYAVADASPLAPSGDDFFAWVPLIYPLVVGPFWLFQILIGLPGLFRPSPAQLGRETATVVFGIQVLLVPALFVVFPGWGTEQGFPLVPAVVLTAVVGLLVSLVPCRMLFRGALRRREIPASTLILAVGGCIVVTGFAALAVLR